MITHADIYNPTTRRALFVAKELVKKNHDITIILPAPEGNILLRGLNEKRFGVNIFHSKYSKSIPANFIHLLMITTDMFYKILKSNFDVIHAFKPLTNGLIGLIGSKLKRKHFILDLDDLEGKGGWADTHPYYQGLAAEILEQTIPKYCDAITIVNKLRMALILNKKLYKNLVYIPNGVDPKIFNPDINDHYFRNKFSLYNSPVIMYAGSLLESFDVDLLINAFPIVLRAYPKAKCIIGGKGRDMHRLIRLSKQLGLENNIIFTGWITHNKYPSFLAMADICVAPYRNRLIHKAACPIKIIEYMSMGKPVIAGNVGEAMNYMEHMKSGVLIKPGDVEQLANAIIRLLEDKELAENLGKNARKRVLENYSWNIIASKFEEIYKHLAMRTKL